MPETERSTTRLALAVIVALLLIALIGYARGEPGDDGRSGDPEDLAVTVEAD
jgi:hypothetical protein